MSIAQFTEFVKKIMTENDNPASDTSGTGGVLHEALKNLQGTPEQKLETIATKLSEVAKSQGYDVSSADVSAYINSLKIQYETNAAVANLVDTYCSTSCHFGSLVSAK